MWKVARILKENATCIWFFINWQIVESKERKLFDPKIGFIVEPPSPEDSQSIFHCKINGIEDKYVLRYSSKYS